MPGFPGIFYVDWIAKYFLLLKNQPMLKDSLYTIQNITEENNTIEAIIELEEHHDIFQGHFPGQPVLPGVCMLQMTKEILEIFFNYKVQLSKADDILF